MENIFDENPPYKPEIGTGGLVMVPKIIEKKGIALVGMDFFGRPFEKAPGWSVHNEVGLLWQRFIAFFDRNKDKIRGMVSDSGYEVWVEFEGEKESHYVFVGVEVERLEDLPVELVGKTLPSARYALFILTLDELRAGGIGKVYSQWLPEAGLEPMGNFMFEYYDCQRFKGMEDPKSEIDIYVPIK